MRVLVSGASGFIGRSLTAALESHRHEVVGATHRPPRAGEAGIDLDSRSLDTSRLPGGSLGQIDAVVHLAGAPLLGRLSARRRELIRSSRVTTGDVLARSVAALDLKPSVYVTQSAVGYYGDQGDRTLDESSPSGSGFLAGVCRAWEAAARPAADAGIRVVAMRTGIVLGPGGGALRAQLPIFRLGLGGRLGSGQQLVSWISLQDEVRAIRHVLDHPALEGPVNLTAPEPVTNEELTAALAAAVSARPPRLVVPELALRLALGAPAADEMLLSSQKVLPRRLLETGFDFLHRWIFEAIEAALGRVPPPRRF